MVLVNGNFLQLHSNLFKPKHILKILKTKEKGSKLWKLVKSKFSAETFCFCNNDYEDVDEILFW